MKFKNPENIKMSITGVNTTLLVCVNFGECVCLGSSRVIQIVMIKN